MFPYFSLTHISLGPLTIQVWGLMVALGILAGAAVGARLASRRGLDPKRIWDLAFWVTLGAFLFARLAHVLAYEPSYYLAHPIEMLYAWDGGFSIVGGFIGAALFGLIYLRRKHVDVWAYADTAIFGLPLGLFIGRIGCFLIHDHPGTATDFFLGVPYPDGVTRWDHGLLDSLNGLAMFVVFLVLLRFPTFIRGGKGGSLFVTIFLIWYGLFRFITDFFRIADATYFGLTPAQYAAMGMVAIGVGIWIKSRQGCSGTLSCPPEAL